MKRLLLLLLPLLLGADAPKVPPAVSAAPGIVVVPVDCPTPVQWYLLDKGFLPVPPEVAALFRPDIKAGVWTINQPGVYHAICWTGDKTDGSGSPPASVTITVSVPVPPPPPDTLAEDIAAALTLEIGTAEAKQTDIQKLAAIYRQSDVVLNDPAVKTAADVLIQMHKGADKLVGDRLPLVRKRLAAELVRVLPTDGATPLDDALKATMRTQFARIAKSLTGGK